MPLQTCTCDRPTPTLTGQERDAENGLDYFGARYFSGAQGRFTSPDKPFADQDDSDPQSWNLYSYVRNNPLIFKDHRGAAHTRTFVDVFLVFGADLIRFSAQVFDSKRPQHESRRTEG